MWKIWKKKVDERQSERVREKRENHLRGPDCKGRNRQRVNEEKKERTHFTRMKK